MHPLVTAAILAFLLTCLVLAIELPARAKSNVRACISYPTLVYVAILTVGNLLTTLLAYFSINLGEHLGEYEVWRPVASAVAGVFAFEAVLSNSNITYLDRNILTISDWIATARDQAIAQAVKAQARRDDDQALKLANLLTELEEGRLNTYIANNAKQDVSQLDSEAANQNLDRKLHKALVLVAKISLDRVASIVKAENLSPPSPWSRRIELYVVVSLWAGALAVFFWASNVSQTVLVLTMPRIEVLLRSLPSF